MKRTDRLFQKSVAGKSRHIPAGYNRRIADTLNSLPDVAPCVSEETTAHVITHKRNYRYISAVSAAAIIMITASAFLHYGITSGDNKNDNDPKTTVKVTQVPVTTSDQYGKTKKPSVTYETSLSQADKTISESQKNNGTQNHDIAGDPDQMNKNNSSASVTKVNGNAAVTENNKADKAENTKKPSDNEPSSPGYKPSVTNAPVQSEPVVTAPEPVRPDNGKDKNEENDDKDWEKDKHENKKEENGVKDGNNPPDRPGPAGKVPYEEKPEPDHFIGGNDVGSKPAGLPEKMEREAEKIQREMEKPGKMAERAPGELESHLPDIPKD